MKASADARRARRPAVLVHREGDWVGIAIEALEAGVEVAGLVLESSLGIDVTPGEPIPFGHKVALRDVGLGDEVVEYAAVIGAATADIPAGSLVHTHNLRSLRWPGADAG